ncbi:unnamed protein product [Symbiodinium natans]|uniref:Uncharacterized protein n=1 Tax=Symbiodinium natans TaxID=878477 RepID=A0A812UK13_9DINO|nr:unnamed protein product [Symbiodinium natans]
MASSPKAVRLSSKAELEDTPMKTPEMDDNDSEEGVVHASSTMSSSEWQARPSTTSGARAGGVTSNFILTKGNTTFITEKGHGLFVSRLLKNPIVGNCLGLVTLFDAYLSCADIDRRAAGIPEPIWLSLSMETGLRGLREP